MSKIECSAKVASKEERETIKEWLQKSGMHSFSENGSYITATYLEDTEDPENNSKKWAMIHFFEQYPEHTIYGSDS